MSRSLAPFVAGIVAAIVTGCADFPTDPSDAGAGQPRWTLDMGGGAAPPAKLPKLAAFDYHPCLGSEGSLLAQRVRLDEERAAADRAYDKLLATLQTIHAERVELQETSDSLDAERKALGRESEGIDADTTRIDLARGTATTNAQIQQFNAQVSARNSRVTAYEGRRIAHVVRVRDHEKANDAFNERVRIANKVSPQSASVIEGYANRAIAFNTDVRERARKCPSGVVTVID